MGATGLVKASLYHRFAGGKEDMAAAVIDRVAQAFAKSVPAPLAEVGDPAERLQKTSKRLLKFYGSGGNPCLLDTLTLNRENSAVRARARSTLQFWVNAFRKFAKECGLPSDIARQPRARPSDPRANLAVSSSIDKTGLVSLIRFRCSLGCGRSQ